MYDSQSLSHTKWECKYHIVWIPKYRKKALFVELRKYLGKILRESWPSKKNARCWRGISCLTMCISCFPYRPSIRCLKSLRFIKGKSAIQIARNFQGRKKNFVGQNFWAISGPEVIMFQ